MGPSCRFRSSRPLLCWIASLASTNVLRRFSLPKWEPTCSVFPQQGTWPRGSASVQATIPRAGKQIRGTTRKGDRWLRQALIEAAQRAMRTKDTYLSAQGRRLTHRRGKKRAVVAVAHSILIIAYHILQRQQPYHDLGRNYFDERERSAIARQSVRRLEHLGFKVTLETAEEAA
jgi:hypothetical protein